MAYLEDALWDKPFLQRILDKSFASVNRTALDLGKKHLAKKLVSCSGLIVKEPYTLLCFKESTPSELLLIYDTFFAES